MSYVLREKDSSCEPAILASLPVVTTALEGGNGFLKEKVITTFQYIHIMTCRHQHQAVYADCSRPGS